MKNYKDMVDLMTTDMKILADGWDLVKNAKTTEEMREGLGLINAIAISLDVLTNAARDKGITR